MNILKISFFITILSICLYAQSYERSYTYNASENDSKSSARKAALTALKTQLIQEVGVNIISSFEKTTTVKNDKYNNMIKSNLQTFSIALTKTEILDEKWDGEKFWIKVLITIDEEKINSEFQKQVKIQENKKEDENLQSLRDEIKIGLYNLRTQDLIDNLSLKAIKLPMDSKKNIDTHILVLHTFQTYALYSKVYRDFLFKTLETAQVDWDDYKVSYIFKYLAKAEMYNKDEQNIILELLARMPQNMQRRYYVSIFSNMKDSVVLDGFVNKYLQNVQNSKVGRPVPISLQKELKYVLKVLPLNLSSSIAKQWSVK